MNPLWVVTGAALPALTALSIGIVLTRRTPLPAPLRFAVGAAVLSLLVFVLFLAGIARPWILWPIGIAGSLSLLAVRPRMMIPIPVWVWPVLILYGGLYLSHAMAPEIQGDARHYHLALAAQTLTSGSFPGRITFYSVLPQGMETLFAFAFAIGGESAAKLLHLVFLTATLPLITSVAARLSLPPASGVMAAVFYAVTPVVGITASCSYNDAALALYTLAVFSLLLWGNAPVWTGVCAGFCYAIKFTGGWVAALGFLILAWRRQWNKLLLYSAAAVLMAGPWILRAALLTGNPFAPLLDSIFPNQYFHIETINSLSRFLRDYGGLPWTSIPWQLTIRGDVLQGLLGPAWLAVPLGLLALRSKQGRILLAPSLLAALPWFLNIGTRFLIPALPLLALALFAALPLRLAAIVLALHLVTSWPAVIRLYAAPAAWTLPAEIPWRAALGLEDADAYRNARFAEAPIPALIRSNTAPGDHILDLVNVPFAATQRDLVNIWQTASGDRIFHALELARDAGPGQFVEWLSDFPARSLSAVRIRFGAALPHSTAIREIRFLRDGLVLSPTIVWALDAWPNIWEAPLAIDRNRASGWSTWQPVQAGMYWSVEFNASRQLDGIQIIADNSATGAALELWGEDRGWQALPLGPARPLAPLNLRLQAMSLARREGITHVVAQRGEDGAGKIAEAIEQDARDWGLRPIARHENLILYRLAD